MIDRPVIIEQIEQTRFVCGAKQSRDMRLGDIGIDQQDLVVTLVGQTQRQVDTSK